MNIVFDIDDSILDTTAAIRDYYLSLYPCADISEYDYVSDWNIYSDDKLNGFKTLIAGFFDSPYLEKINPLPGAVDVIRRLKQSGHLLSVLSASTNKPENTERRKKYLECLLGTGVIDNFCFIGPLDSKKDKLAELKADILVDDGMKNVQTALEIGICGILLRTKQNAKYIDLMNSNDAPESIQPSFWKYDFDKIRGKAIVVSDWQQILQIIEDKE